MFPDFIPWWLWVVVGLAVVIAVNRYVSLRAAFASAVVIVTALVYKLGRRKGAEKVREQAIEKDAKDAEKITETATDARARSDRRNADPTELRKSDGWRRD